ncbi:MAG: sugar phosphate isomerase/epimerase [Oscillospiraceae bacterium]|nr:sugar phosphate isomerase/epimerase [Lachnospiraceae bacterium]MBR0160166.1 sugar phosphate isomerase/epimerase [Oscillospiraceae bacterium]
MRDSIHKYFQVGTIRWMSYPRLDAVEAVRRIASDDYFDAIEVRHCVTDEEREETRKILQQSHLKVCYGAQPSLLGPKLNPNDLDEEGRLKAEKVLIEALDEAEYLGAQGIAFLAGKWQEETKEEAYQQLLKTTVNVCKAAAAKNMNVELEVFDYDVDKAALIGPSPLAARFAADVRLTCPNFGLLVDLSHFPICHEKAKDVVRTCRPYITHLHFGNAVADPAAEGYGDLHQRFGYPGSANDIPELLDYLEVLKEEGFFNAKNPMVLSMEVSPTKDEDEEVVLANTKRCLNRAWALLED